MEFNFFALDAPTVVADDGEVGEEYEKPASPPTAGFYRCFVRLPETPGNVGCAPIGVDSPDSLRCTYDFAHVAS
ncbi:hypothetical protein VIMS_00512 [Mycobacterium marinum]|nr:hypothetical protein VIMS_00512 [Mycobacterium marinum]